MPKRFVKHHSWRVRSLAYYCTLVVCGSATLFGQTQTAEINGEVRDASQSLIVGARVVATNVQTKLARATVSSSAGKYVLSSLSAGSYDVVVEAKGFQKSVAHSVNIDVNQTLTLDFAMRIGEVTQTLNVVAEGAQIDSTTAQLGTVITEEKIHELPLNGRNFTELLTLEPGATPVSTGQNNGVTQVEQIGTTYFPSINGQQNRSNAFFIDGIVNNGTYMGTYMVAPNVDTVSEFKVEASTAQAQFGGVNGGTITLITKSGTNQFHGSAYEFLRNDALDARGFFTTKKPSLRQDQFGGTIGGPVRPNRVFFFGSYEGYRHKTPASTLTLVPTAQQLSGNFSGSSRVIYDPFSTQPNPNSTGFIRTPFPNNTIPASEINPSTMAWAKAIIPAPNVSGFGSFNYLDTDSNSMPAGQYSTRVDGQIDSHDYGFLRAIWGTQSGVTPQSLAGVNTSVHIQSDNFGGGFTRVLNPSTVFNAQFGLSYLERRDQPFLTSEKLIQEGYFSGLPYNAEVTAPGITLANGFSVTTRNRTWGPMRQWQLGGDITHTVGSHTIKAGASWVDNPWRYSAVDGSLSFTTAQTANPSNLGLTGIDIASFLLGVPDSTTYLKDDLKVRSATWALFIQDSWRVTPRLTISAGLRWDILLTPTWVQEFPGVWDINTGLYIAGIKQPPACGPSNPPPCLVDPNNAYNNSYVRFTGNTKIQPNDYGMIGPRLGLAYRVRPKVVVRSFYGIFYDVISGVNQQGDNAEGWPNVTGNTLTGLNYTTVQYTASSPFGGSTSLPDPTPVRQSQYLYDPKFKRPRSMQWHTQVESQLPGNNVLTVGYAGAYSDRLNVSSDYNTATVPGPGPISARQPFPYMPVLAPYDRSVGKGWYDALQVKLEHRFSRDFTYLMSYTWGKSIDYASSGLFAAENQSIQNQYNPRESKSVSGYDIPQDFSVAALYTLPFGPGKQMLNHGVLSKVLGNWQLNGILLLRSGQPFTPVMNVDSANIGAAESQTRVRPNLVGDPALANPSPGKWFNTAAFAPPPAYQYGTAGRNILRTDALKNLDLSLFREQRIGERVVVQLRAEAFNVGNHPTFGIPNATYTSSSFGQVSSTISTSRQIQLGLRLAF